MGVDLDARDRPTVIADVRSWPLHVEPGSIDFLWSSPPCTEFSDANPLVEHRTKSPSLELVKATLEIVAAVRPRYWIMENVRGAIPFLGIPAQKIGPFCLWGYFPHVRATEALQLHRKWRFHDARRRAAVPRGLSEAVADALERQLDAGGPPLLDLRPPRRHRRLGPLVDKPTPMELFGDLHKPNTPEAGKMT